MSDFVLRLLAASPQTWRFGSRVEVGDVLDSMVLSVLPPVLDRGAVIELRDGDEHRSYRLSGDPIFHVDANRVRTGLPTDLIFVDWYARDTVPSEERNAERDARPDSSRLFPFWPGRTPE